MATAIIGTLTMACTDEWADRASFDSLDFPILVNPVLNRSEDPSFVPGEVLVKLKANTSPGRAQEIHKQLGTRVVYTSPFGGFNRVRLPPGWTVAEGLRRLRQFDDVLYAEPNTVCRANMVPNDTYYSYQWHLDNEEYGGVGAEAAWDVQQGSSSVVVAVLDSGIAYEDHADNQGNGRGFYLHPDLAGTPFVGGYDAVKDDMHANDDNGHGTAVAGVIAQTTNNDLGTAGLAFGVTLMPVKVLSKSLNGTAQSVADGLYFAVDNGAHVVNMSLSWPQGEDPGQTLLDAVAYAYEAGVTLVGSAGNDSAGQVNYPAAYDDYVIAVGATRYDETVTWYSNYGSSLDVVAPGGDLDVDQNGDGYGDGVLAGTFDKKPDDFVYYFWRGTSFSAPHVSGLAALLLSQNPTWSPADVRAAIEATAKDLGEAGWDERSGWGLIDAPAALAWSEGGWGKGRGRGGRR